MSGALATALAAAWSAVRTFFGRWRLLCAQLSLERSPVERVDRESAV